MTIPRTYDRFVLPDLPTQAKGWLKWATQFEWATRNEEIIIQFWKMWDIPFCGTRLKL
jgi:hypothetical protein